MITEETITRVKVSLQREKAFFTLEVIEDLEKQIKKMRCCENCRYYAGADFTCNVIRATKYGAIKDKNGEDCNNLDKWELAE